MNIVFPLQKRGSKKIFVAALAVLLLLLLRTSLLRAFVAVERPFAAVGTWMSQNTSLLFVGEDSLRAQVEELERQRAALAVDRAAYASLEEEHAQLKKQLAFLEQRDLAFVSAPIVAQNRQGEHAQRFLINRGRADGIMVGLPAIVDEGILIGKVVAITEHTATIAELSDAQTATAVTLLNRTRTIGLAEGRAGALLLIRFIPHDEKVEQDDLVVTSGLEEHVPSGLVVGLINSVRTDPAAPFQEAIVEPLGDIRKHRAVAVIIP